MSAQKTDLLIIGGGLTGLALAYYLRREPIKVHLLEARDRVGGRILTIEDKQGPPREMGATWLGKKHRALTELLGEVGLDIFEQQLGDRAIYESISTSPPQLVRLPPNEEPSYRIRGGSNTLIEALATAVGSDRITTDTIVRSIRDTGEKLLVTTDGSTFEADHVVSTLPPYLLLKTIDCTPEFSPELTAILSRTHTWMGDSIKVSLSYDRPFWRSEASSGTIFSNAGPIGEMYDHSDVEDNRFALKGFFNGAYHPASREERLALVLGQLRKYYGDVVDDYLAYEEKVWRNEPFTFTPYDHALLPHQHNGHPAFRATYMGGKLIIAGSETADQFPGYMDGAVRSARYVRQLLVEAEGKG